MSKAQDLMNEVNKVLGAGTIRTANHPDYQVTYAPTGVLPFDILLQGGLPRGRMVELYGDYSTMKSYVGYNALAACQQRGGTCALIDTEHAFEDTWGRRIGIDVDNLLMPPVATGEEAMDAAEALIRGGIDLIVVDSIAATLPQAEAAKRLHKESMQPGRQAQLMSAALRRLTAANKHTSMLWINQTRLNIGVTFGSPEALPGGKAMPFYASYRVAARKVGKITKSTKYYTGDKWQDGKEQIGQKFKMELLKSKLSKPFREVWFDWSLETDQIDVPGFLIAQGVENGIITIKGNTWHYGSLKVVGRENFKDRLATTPDTLADLTVAVLDHHGLASPSISRGSRAPAAKKALAPKKSLLRH